MFMQCTGLTGDEQMCWPGEKAGKPDSSSATTVALYGMLGDTVVYPNIKEIQKLNICGLNSAQHVLEFSHMCSPENLLFISYLK